MKRFLSVALTMSALIWAAITPATGQENPSPAEAATPEAQAAKIYRALRDQDYEAMFYLLAFTPKGKGTLSTAQQFALDMRKGYEGSFKTKEEQEATDQIFKSIAEIMVGEPVIADGKAVVPVSAKITANGRTMLFKGHAHLIRDEDTWKFDLTIDEDSEKAMTQRVAELLGKPDLSP